MPDEINREVRSTDAEPDPVVDSSLSGPLLIAAVVLFLTMVWALYDELFSQRPWKHYQAQFVRLYTAHLQKVGPRAAAAEKEARSSPEFQKIEQLLKKAEDSAAPKVIFWLH